MNEALSELYIEDEDHEKLRESVDDYDNFDQVRTIMDASRLWPGVVSRLCGDPALSSSFWELRSTVDSLTGYVACEAGGGVHECHPPMFVCIRPPMVWWWTLAASAA